MPIPSPGDVFDARFRIEREIGRGGFATVFAATDVDAGTTVALKILTPGAEGGYEWDVEQRFSRELEALSRLKSEHTVRMLTHGRSADGTLYVAFEYLRGVELAELLRQRERLEPPEVEHVLRQLLQSLGEAHRLGLLHRDLKPENIIVCEHERDPLHVKLIDWGIARPLDDGSPSVTKTGELIGTPRYMSPEQLTERPITPASDLYSLGMIAYEMALGRDALQGGAWGDQLDRLRSGHVFSVPEYARLGPKLHGVISKMSARRPEDRFASSAAVLTALDGVTRPSDIEEPAHSRLWVLPALGVLTLLTIASLALAFGGSEPTTTISPRALNRTMPGNREPSAPPEPPAIDVPDDPRSSDSAGCHPNPGGADLAAELEGEALFVPVEDAESTPRPLFVLLHDRHMTGADFLRGSGFVELAQERNFIVVAPQVPDLGSRLGLGFKLGFGSKMGDQDRNAQPYTNWDSVPGAPLPAGFNGLQNARQVVERITNAHCVDLDRVFLVGQGDGGRGALWLSCEHSWVRGVATNSHAGDPIKGCLAWEDRPFIPIIRFHGRQSEHRPPFGDRDCAGNSHPELNEVDERWAKALGCTTDDPPFARSDKKGTVCRSWTCERSSPPEAIEFRSCLLDGGHPWSGFGKRISEGKPIECDGEPADFDTAAAMVEFFLGASPDARQE